MKHPKCGDFVVTVAGGFSVGRRAVSGRIVGISQSTEQVFYLGARVASNGRHSNVPAGASGTIVNLVEPGTPGYTSNIIDVWFDGDTCPTLMKPKEIVVSE